MRKFVISAFATVMFATLAFATPQVAKAWGEAEYTGNGQPQFNTYTNVPGNVGNEKDFLRVGKNGAVTSTFTNNFEACEGEARVTTYIHNGAPEGFNGQNNNGTGVARDTKLSITIPKTSKDEISAIISASNAPSVTDKARITCNGQEVELEYVKGSAEIFSQLRGEAKLSDAVVNGGTKIGTYADDGVVPGCWDYRVYVSLVVKIKKVEKPQPIVKCVSISPISIGDNKYRFKLQGYAQNATIKGYTFDFGDGKKQEIVSSDKEVTSEEHTFTKNSKVQGSVKFDVDGQTKTENGPQCAVEIKLGEKPVPPTPVTPEVKPAVTVLPNTGPAEMLAGVSGISALGYSVRRWIESRRG